MGEAQGRATVTPDELKPLLAALEPTIAFIRDARVPGLIIGGVAVSLLGKPRLTADIDAVVLASEGDLEGLLNQACRQGLEPRIPDAVGFARDRRVLLLRHPGSGIGVDVSLGLLPFEQEAVGRGRRVTAGTLEFMIPTPEDLIVMKAVAHRAKDLEDIRGILAQHRDLDVAHITNWVRQFAEVLEAPEVWGDLKTLIEGKG